MGRYIEEKPKKSEEEYYEEWDSNQEEDMPESAIHAELIHYLIEVLRWQFHGESCAIYENLNLYPPPRTGETPIVPDIMVIKGFPYRRMSSWKISRMGRVPQVVLEIASPETWELDVTSKLEKYGRLGVQEYFFYDPDQVGASWHGGQRLHGWRLNPLTGEMHPLEADEQGRLWSVQLESWLVPDREFLRLADHSLHIRLTGKEAQEQRAKAEAQRAETLAREKEALLQQLRSLGVNPDLGMNPDKTIEKLQ